MILPSALLLPSPQGAAASLQNVTTPITLELAKELAGDAFTPEMEQRFSEIMDPETKVASQEDIASFLCEFDKHNNSDDTADEGDNAYKVKWTRAMVKLFSTLSLSMGLNTSTGAPSSKWLFVRAKQKFRDLPKINKEDMADEKVRQMMAYIDGTPELSSQNLDDKIREASLSDAERQALAA